MEFFFEYSEVRETLIYGLTLINTFMNVMQLLQINRDEVSLKRLNNIITA